MRAGSTVGAWMVMLLEILVPSDLWAGGSESKALTGIVLDTPATPTPLPTRDGIQLLYELHITNLRTNDLELKRLEIVDPASPEPLATLQPPYLDEWIRRPIPGSSQRLIASGQRIVLFLNLTFETKSLPPRLRQRLVFQSAGDEEITEVAFLQTRKDPRISIAPPLRDGHWYVLNGLASRSHHRLSWFPVAGRPVVPQRYAIDWILLGPDDKPFQGDPRVLTNYYGYAADVIAVADATVTAVRDGYPDCAPLSADGASNSMEDATGNHILLELDSDHFALYAHLQPGSLRVKVGDRVQRGQWLGRLGNSGASTAPHLHFHIVGSDSPIFADGLPYVLDSFEWHGVAASFDALMEGKGFARPPSPSPDRCLGQLPLNNSIVRFP